MFWKSFALLLVCFLLLALVNAVPQHEVEHTKCSETHHKCIEAQRQEDKQELQRLQSEWELHSGKTIGEEGRR